MPRMSTHHEGGKEASVVRKELDGRINSLCIDLRWCNKAHPSPPHTAHQAFNGALPPILIVIFFQLER